jgi:hypothetical protein
MGAMSFGRWQTTQFLKRMGATSRLKVTSFAVEVCGAVEDGVEAGVWVGVETEGVFEVW